MTAEPGNDMGNVIAWKNVQPTTIQNETSLIWKRTPYGVLRRSPCKCVI